MMVRGQRHIVRVAGVALVSAGLLLLLGVGSFYAYGFYSYTQLDNLNASFEAPLSLPPDFEEVSQASNFSESSAPPTSGTIIHGAIMPDGSFAPVKAAATDTASFLGPKEQTAGQPPAVNAMPPIDSEDSGDELQFTAQSSVFPVSSYTSIYPGFQVHPKYWHQPLWAGTDLFIYRFQEFDDVLQGFEVSASVKPVSQDAEVHAQRIRIPIIGVDSAIEDLAILDLGNSRAYETPKNTVGHIPGTVGPGQVGNGWFFGHLESPIRGEGNVFKKLPKVAEHLTNGDPVYVVLENEDGQYLYQVISSKVIHQDELELYDTDDATITLVTCSNRPIYNYRQLVTAKLIGIKR